MIESQDSCQQIQVSELFISPHNVNFKKKKRDISDLLASIPRIGIVQPLVVIDTDSEQYAVIAGARRLLAARELKLETVPCTVIKADETDALMVSTVENVSRQAMTPMDEYQAFRSLVLAGESIESIASTFATTEKVVEQRLAIANLIPAIHKAFEKGDINDGQLCDLTMADAKQQRAYMALVNKNEAPWSVKQWLFGGQAIELTNAIFPIEQYTGPLATDLFDEKAYFQDTVMFWDLQNAAIEDLILAEKERGWKVGLVRGRFDLWDKTKVSKADGGMVYVHVADNGAVAVHKGYLPKKQAAKAKATDSDKESPQIKAEISGVAQQHVNLQRLAHVQNTVFQAPNHHANRVLIAGLLSTALDWRFGTVRAPRDDILEAYSFTRLPGIKNALKNFESKSFNQIYTELLTYPPGDLDNILAAIAASILTPGSDAVELVGLHLTPSVDPSTVDKDLFLNMVTSKATLTQIAKSLELTEAVGAKDMKTKALRALISNKAPSDWIPNYFQWPFKAYIKQAGLSVTAAVKSARKILGKINTAS